MPGFIVINRSEEGCTELVFEEPDVDGSRNGMIADIVMPLGHTTLHDGYNLVDTPDSHLIAGDVTVVRPPLSQETLNAISTILDAEMTLWTPAEGELAKE